MSRAPPPPPRSHPQDAAPAGANTSQGGGVDPVTGNYVSPERVFARDGDHVFESEQTQMYYFRALEQGLVVEIVGGKPQFVKAKMERIWSLATSEGNFAKITSRTQLPESALNLLLKEGKYRFVASAPELKESYLSMTKRREIHGSLDIRGSKGQAIVPSGQFVLSAEQDTYALEFQVPPEQEPAIVRTEFKSPSLLNALKVEAFIERAMVPLNNSREESARARRQSAAILRPDEFLVELEKDAVGYGFVLTWDPERGAMAIKSINPQGVAARSKVIREGDAIRAVQGTRVDGMEPRQVQQLLRNVPIRALLVLQHAPQGWSGFPQGKAPAPPPRTQGASALGPPPPRPPRASTNLNAGPPPTRPARQSTSSGAQPPAPLPRPSSTEAPPPPARTAQPPSPSAAAPPAPPRSGVAPPVTSRPRPAPPAPAVHESHAARRRPAPPPMPPVAAPQQSPRPAPPTPESITAPPPAPPVRRISAPPPPEAPRVQRAPSGGLQQAAAPVPFERAAAPPPPRPQPAVVAPPPPAPLQRAPSETRAEAASPTREAVQPSAPPPEREATPAAASEFGPEFAKYVKMKRAGLPDGAIVNAMNRDGVAVPPGFFPENFSAPKPVAIKVTKASAPDNGGDHPARGGGGGGGSLVAALQGFDASKLKKRDPDEVAAEAPRSAPVNPLMAELEKKAQGGLRRRSQAEIDAEAEERAKADLARKGQNLFNEALLEKFKNANPVEDEDEDVNNNEWSDFEM